MPTNTAAINGVLSGRSKVIAATRDTSAATASVSYTGVGFKPRAIIAFGTVNLATTGTMITTVAVVDSSAGFAGMQPVNNATGTVAGVSTFLGFFVDASNNQQCTVTSLDADGFTLSWTKTGTVTGTAQLMFLCLQ